MLEALKARVFKTSPFTKEVRKLLITRRDGEGESESLEM